jgi:hypothetical protein
MLTFTPVQSSNLSSVAYDRDQRRLWVTFHSGGSGYYEDVPESVYFALMSAYSKGSFHAAYIVGQYTWRKAGT